MPQRNLHPSHMNMLVSQRECFSSSFTSLRMSLLSLLLFCLPSLFLCFYAPPRPYFTLSRSRRRTSTDVIEDPETGAKEYFYVTPNGLNIQVLSTNKEGEPVRSRANEITIADFMQQNDDEANAEYSENENGESGQKDDKKAIKRFKSFEKKLDMISSWFSSSEDDTSKKRALGIYDRAPILFIHGSFHGAWCFAEHYFRYFSDEGKTNTSRLCYSLSLRGTSASGMPPGDQSTSIDISSHMDDVRFVLANIRTLPATSRKPVLVAHSFGGLIVLKLLESVAFRDSIGGVVLLCSVPPSGNGPMTGRFMKRDFIAALKIVWGFVFKAACTIPWVAEELFFEDGLDKKDLRRYMKHFQEDSRVGIDLQALADELPIKNVDSRNGKVRWVNDMENSPSSTLPLPVLVIGAGKDFIVDREGVEETAKFLGVEPTFIEDAHHDLMLGPNWQNSAEVIEEWLLKNKL